MKARGAETEQSDRCKSILRDTNLYVIFCVTLMAVLGVSSITPAFPKMAEELGVSAGSIGLLITVFTLPGIFLALVFGIMADRWGRKKVLVPSLFVFAVAGGACAFVRDFQVLLALRFVQGIGAACLGSLNAAIIGDLYAGRDRAAAMGYNASVLSIGTASYPAIGGALATLGWNYPFLLSFTAIPVGFFVLFSLGSPEPGDGQKFGAYIKGVWRGIKSRQVLGLFAACAVTFIILYGVYLTYFPISMGKVFSAPPFLIGLMMSSMSLATMLSSSQMGRLARRFSERTLMMVGFAFYAASLMAIPFAPDVRALILPAVIFGLAHGVNVPSVQTLLAGLAPMEQRAAFMSANGVVLRLGQTVGPVLMGLIFGMAGLPAVFVAGAALAAGMVIFVAMVIK